MSTSIEFEGATIKTRRCVCTTIMFLKDVPTVHEGHFNKFQQKGSLRVCITYTKKQIKFR